MHFWQEITKPIIALSPMDGVTDAPYRYIAAKYGRPDIQFTEFTNVEGLARSAWVMLDDFLYSEIERPVVAQIYGSEPESYYKIAIVVCALGFDGIDINMGCPAKKVASRGCGAGLILNPDLAKEIIRSVQGGIADWMNGKSPEEISLQEEMVWRIREMNRLRTGREEWPTRRALPVSVKTRIGYDRVVIKDWVKHLLEVEPAAISIHGRTLKQMYSGQADWEAIARASEIIRQTSTLALGNGDITTVEDMITKIRTSKVDGVLLGRGALGNPWIFNHKDEVKALVSQGDKSSKFALEVDATTRFDVLLEHARYFERTKGVRRFSGMRKHFGWYCKGMPGAAQLRKQMCQTSNSQEVAVLLQNYRDRFPQIFQ